MGCGTSRVSPQPIDPSRQTRKDESKNTTQTNNEASTKDQQQLHESRKESQTHNTEKHVSVDVNSIIRDRDSIPSRESENPQEIENRQQKEKEKEQKEKNDTAEAKVDDEFDYPIPYIPPGLVTKQSSAPIDVNEKETTVHIRFVNEDETDMYCAFPVETSFWQIISKVRTAYGLPICFKDPLSNQIIYSTSQYASILEAYQKNEAEHLEIYTVVVDSPDLDDMDDFEHMYEEKKSQVYLRCTLDEDEPIDCTFPMPFGLMELKGYFRGLKDGAMLLNVSYGKMEPVFVRDNEQFQQVLSDYRKSFYKYLHVILKHKVISDIDEDEEEELLLEKKSQIRIEFHIDSEVYEIMCPPSVDLESLKSKASGLISGQLRIMVLETESPNLLTINSEEDLRKIINEFCSNTVPKLPLFISADESTTEAS